MAEIPPGDRLQADHDNLFRDDGDPTKSIRRVSDATALAKLDEILQAVDGLEGFTDGLEGAIASANSLLTTIRDNADQIEGFVDGLEGFASTANTLLTSIRDNADSVESLLTAINLNTDGLEAFASAGNALLTTIRDNADTVESLLSAVGTNTDGIETLITSSNSLLTAIGTNTDGIEALIGSTNTLIGTSNTLLTAIGANTDTLESLAGTTNTLLTTIRDNADQVEGLLTTIRDNADTVEILLTSIDAGTPDSLGQKVMSQSQGVVIASDQSPASMDNRSIGQNAAASPTFATMIGAHDGTNIQRLIAKSSQPNTDDIGLIIRPLPYWPQTFSIHAKSVAIGNAKSMLSVLNASGSAVIMRLLALKIFSIQTSAVTGVMAEFGLRKITAHSGGTVLNTTGSASGLIYPYDSNNALNGSITARTGATAVTESPAFDILRWLWSSDEFGPGTADAETQEHTDAQLVYAWEQKTEAQPMVFRAQQGFHIRQNTNSTAGTFDIWALITQGAT